MKILMVALGVALACPVVGAADDVQTTPAKGAASACRLVTPDEAASLVGSVATPVPGADRCTYCVRGKSIELAIRTEATVGGADGAYREFVLGKAKWDEGSARGDNPPLGAEPSLGENASSVRNRDSFYFLVRIKKTLLEIELRDKGKPLPPALFEKTRDVVKAAAGRL